MAPAETGDGEEAVMSARQLLEAFDRWRAEGVPLVLVTVTQTLGSTYSKAGHRILLTGSGEFQGLVSGGCLEGDLAEHAREVLAGGQARALAYDLRDEHDELWGLGIGCNGLFRLLLQPLSASDGYAPFAAIAERMRGEDPGATATVVESDDERLPPGATVVSAGAADPLAWRVEPPWRERLIAGCDDKAGGSAAELRRETVAARAASILYAPLRPLPRLLVLGAGLDAVPLAEMAHHLGWRVTVADHRPAYLARGDFPSADALLQLEPARLAAAVPLVKFSAVVVMSHHLETDRGWLAALAPFALPYVGLLGPAERGARLLAEIGAAGVSLRSQLHSPAGLAIGADSPESIALAILAEMHATLRQEGVQAAGDR